MVAAVNATPASAGAWTTSGRVSGGATYDDNVLFVADQPIHDYYGRLEATGNLQFVGDHLRFELQPRLVAYDYASFKANSRVDQYIKGSLTDSGERWKSPLSLSVARDTTLTSEIGTTGLTEINKRHESLQANWTPSYQASEKLNVGTQLSVQTSRYKDAANTTLLDYDYGSAALNAGYAITALSTLKLQASAGRLQVVHQPRYTQKNYDMTVGYSRQIGEKWQADASFGPSVIQTRAQQAASRGDVYHLGATRTAERGRFSFGLDQLITPNGFGVLSKRQAATLDWRYAVSERISVGFSGQWSRTRNFLPLLGFELNRLSYNDLSAIFEWSPASSWYVSASIGHGQQSYSYAVHPAKRAHADLSLVWTGLEHVHH
jgi:hypothetical protein